MWWRALILGALLAACSGPDPVGPADISDPPAAPTPHPLPAVDGAPAPPGAPGTVPPTGGACPPGYPIKGLGREPGEAWYALLDHPAYAALVPEVCFATLDDAHEAGYGPPPAWGP